MTTGRDSSHYANGFDDGVRPMGGGPREFYRFPDDGGSGSGHQGGALRVLIVDDNELIVELLSDMFAHERGYEVRVARSGREAVEEFERFNPDLVILDIMLGDSDGRSLCRQFKETDSPAKVIAMSGYMPMSEIPTLAATGFDHYLRKPFRIDDVLCLVERLGLRRRTA